MERYKFGNMTIQINCPRELKKDTSMEVFRTEKCETKKVINLNIIIEEYSLPDNVVLLHDGGGTKYYSIDEGWVAVYQKKTMDRPAIGLVVKDNQNLDMYIREDIPDYYFTTHELLKHIELIEMLIMQDMWVLHSCFVKSEHGAILFTGNSGAGKSTQGSLWQEFGLGEVINGDRSLIYHENGEYYANGFVYAGSSKICKNDAAKIKAIVLVKQSGVNRVTRLSAPKAIKTLYLQTVSSSWRDNEKKLEFVTRLFENVEVLQLECQISKEAVLVLDDYLKGMSDKKCQ